MKIPPTLARNSAKEIADQVVAQLSNRPQLVDRYDLAKAIGVSVSTIDRARRDKQIPFLKIGRRVLYSPEAVVAALSKQPLNENRIKKTK